MQDFAQKLSFLPPWTCRGWKCQFFQNCWPNPGCSKLSFFTTADMPSLIISIFPKMLALCRILLKIVIFDHHGYVEDENVNFSKNLGPFQDFAQNCHFWPLQTCRGWKCQFLQKILAQSKILLKIVIFYHRGHVDDEWCQFFQKCWPNPGCLKLSLFTTADMSSLKMSSFPKMLARLMILLKIVIFDYGKHIEDGNFNFSKLLPNPGFCSK